MRVDNDDTDVSNASDKRQQRMPNDRELLSIVRILYCPITNLNYHRHQPNLTTIIIHKCSEAFGLLHLVRA